MKNNEITKRPDLGIFDKQFPVRLIDAPIDDPTKFTILTGDDGILDDLFSYHVYNHLKNHWRGAVAPGDIQDGMIWSEIGTDKLYHEATGDEEILQLTRSNNVTPEFLGLLLAEYITHVGDANTYVRLETDKISVRAGGIDLVNIGGKVFINDALNADMTIGLTINQAGNDDEILAFKSSDIGHGVTDYAETDTYGYFEKIVDTTGGLKIVGIGESNYAVSIFAIQDSDIGSGDTHGTAGIAPIQLNTAKKSGTGIGNVSANHNLCVIRGYVGGGWLTKWLVDEDGDTWQDGTIQALTGTTVGGASCIKSAGNTKFFTIISSKKYKDKIKDLELDSMLIYNLQPRSFNSLCEADDKKKRFHGFIAEEIEKEIPEIINYDENKKADSYDNQMLTTLILAEVQRHEARIKALEAQLNN